MNADQWYYTKDELRETPSIIGGCSFEEEQTERAKGCNFILAVGTNLALSQLVLFSATTYFHRFYMRKSLKRHAVYSIAATCLFIATKAEEGRRRMDDFISNCARKAQKLERLELTEDSRDYIKWKCTLLYNEIIVLETLCFDLVIEHPHLSLMDMYDQLEDQGTVVRESVTHKAWILLCQTLGAPLCLIHKPRSIAAAAYLLANNLSVEKRLCENWYERFSDIDVVEMHQLAAEMLEFCVEHYKAPATSQANSPHPPSIHQ